MSAELRADLEKDLDRLDWPVHHDDPIAERAGTITDDGHANYALRKLASAEAEVAEIAAIEDEYIAGIRAWAERRRKPFEQEADFRRGQLIEYHERLLADDPDRKTLDLPSGRVKSRTSKPAVVIDDLDELVEWLVEVDRGDEITWTPKVGVRQVRKFVTAHDGNPVDMDLGERVPGLSVRPGKTSFTVDV